MNGSDIRTKDDGRDYRVPPHGRPRRVPHLAGRARGRMAGWLAPPPSRSLTGPWTSSRNAPNGCWKTRVCRCRWRLADPAGDIHAPPSQSTRP